MLFEVLESMQYDVRPINVGNEPAMADLIMIERHKFSTTEDDLSFLFHNMILSKKNILKPIFIDVKHTVLSHKEINQVLPLDIQEYDIYFTTNMVFFLIFFHEDKWIAVTNGLHFEEVFDAECLLQSSPQYDAIISDCCEKIPFDVNSFDKGYVYTVCVQHKKLMPLVKENKIFLVRCFNKKTQTYLKSVNKISESFGIPLLMKNTMRTRHELLSILDQGGVNMFIIPPKNTSDIHLHICNKTYLDILGYCNLYCSDPYRRFMRIRQLTPPRRKEFLQIFGETENNTFEKIEKAFKEIVKYFFFSYVDVFVNKMFSYFDSFAFYYCHNKEEILYHIHLFHLQTKLPIFKTDIENIFLYQALHREQMIIMLKKFFASRSNKYISQRNDDVQEIEIL